MTCIPLTMILMLADSAEGSAPPPPTTPSSGSEIAFRIQGVALAIHEDDIDSRHGGDQLIPAGTAEILRYGQQQHDLISGAVKSWQHQSTSGEGPMVAVAVTDCRHLLRRLL